MAIKMPEADQFGFVKTFNNTGYMTTYLDEFSQVWVNHCLKSNGLNADIGSAYGVATLAALKDSNAKVLAIDLDPSHLHVLRQEATRIGANTRLSTADGDFPDSIMYVGENSLDNVLICRVLHFFNGDKIKRAAKWCFEKIKLGGRVVVVAETPYLRNFQSFIPIYEKRRADGVEFPGFIDDVHSVAPERAKFLPKQMHLLDEKVLSRVLFDAGFNIERTAMIPRPNFPMDIQLDGRESVGVIACKK